MHHTGRVRWWFGGVIETSCHLDGTLFPFDSQSCSIVIQSWAYSEALVNLRNGSDYVHLDGFNDDGKLTVPFVYSLSRIFVKLVTVGQKSLYNSTGCIKYNEKFERIYDQNARSVHR